MNDQVSTPTEKPPVSVWKRLLLGAGLFILVLIALAVVQDSLLRWRDKDAFRKALAELDAADPGWRLEEIENARPSISETQNSANVVLAANSLRPEGTFRKVELERLPLKPAVELLDGKQMGLLEKELKVAHAGVVEARKLADMPTGRSPRDFPRRPIIAPRKHDMAVGRVNELLRYDALYLAQKNKPHEALRSCRAMINAARSVGDEPLLSSQRTRCDGPSHAATGVERTLALSLPAAKDLADLQTLVEDEETFPGLMVGVRGNRAWVHDEIDSLIKGVEDIEDRISADDPRLGWRVKYAKWSIRDGIRREYPQILPLLNRAVEIAHLPLHEQDVAEKDLKKQTDLLNGKLIFLQRAEWFVRHFGPSFRHKETQLRCLIVLLALERYRQEKGTWPAKLDDLVPGLLKAVPLDPHDGKPLRYKKLPDGVIVYSVGPDKVDDGGLIRSVAPRAPGAARDEGLRLWDVNHRRQPSRLEKAP
jgi:hypothetical protein